MSITLTSIGGKDLNPAWLETRLERGQRIGRATGIGSETVSRHGRWPTFSAHTREGHRIKVVHRIDRDSAAANEQRLRGYLYDGRVGEATLVFIEEGVTKEVSAVPENMEQHPQVDEGCADPTIFQGTWLITSPIAYKQTATATGPTALSGGSPSVAPAVAGNTATEKVTYTLDPTDVLDAADGHYQRAQKTVVNRAPRPLVNWPVLVAQGWDHATIVTATDSLASGNDVWVLAGGRRVPRWAHSAASRGFNTANTDLWVNVTLPAGRKWTLRAAAADDATTLQLEELPTNMPSLPFMVVVNNGSTEETIAVTAVDEVRRELTVQRGQRGTSGLVLSATHQLWWAPASGHIDIIWGWSGAPSPHYIDDRHKPMLLESSTACDNETWTIEEFYETPTAGDTSNRYARPGSWISRALGAYDRERKTGDGDQFWRWVATSSGTPAANVGLEYQSKGAIGGRPLMDRWEFHSPIAISSYEIQLTCSTIKYYDSGSDDLKASVGIYHRAIDGAEELIERHDASGNLDGTGGTITITPSIPVLSYGARMEPFDPKTWEQATLIALEPNDGDGWTITSDEKTFAAAERVLIAGTMSAHNIYMVGRPEEPASLTTGEGSVEISGVVLRLTEELVLDAFEQEAKVTGVEVDRDVGNVLDDVIPALKEDMTSYPAAGTDTVTYGADAITDISISISHQDAWR